jgi:hypothetical protein
VYIAARMKRNYGNGNRYPGHYRQDLLNWCRENAGLSVRGTALKLKANQDTAARVFRGTASQKQVWPFAKFFKIDWSLLHDLTLSPDEFHRAVLNGDSSSVR